MHGTGFVPSDGPLGDNLGCRRRNLDLGGLKDRGIFSLKPTFDRREVFGMPGLKRLIRRPAHRQIEPRFEHQSGER